LGGLNWLQQQQQHQGMMPSTRLIMNMNMAGPSGYATLSAPMFPLGNQEEVYLITGPYTGQLFSHWLYAAGDMCCTGYVLWHQHAMPCHAGVGSLRAYCQTRDHAMQKPQGYPVPQTAAGKADVCMSPDDHAVQAPV
jgi:hypothetical protein